MGAGLCVSGGENSVAMPTLLPAFRRNRKLNANEGVHDGRSGETSRPADIARNTQARDGAPT